MSKKNKEETFTVEFHAYIRLIGPVRGGIKERIIIAFRVLFKGETHAYVRQNLFTKKGLKEILDTQ